MWPPSEPCPFRVEFDAGIVDTIRAFDSVDQRSFAKRGELVLPPAKELVFPGGARKSCGSLVGHLPSETLYFWVENCSSEVEKGSHKYAGIAYHADLYDRDARVAADTYIARQGKGAHSGLPDAIVPFRQLLDSIAARRSGQLFSVLESFPDFDFPVIDLGFQPARDLELPDRSLQTPGAAHDNRQRWLDLLARRAREGARVHFFFTTQGARDHFRETTDRKLFHLHPGSISGGFIHDALRLVVIPESSLILREKVMCRHSEIVARRLAKRRSLAAATISDWISIEPGDLVVHANHGIGKYLGLHEMVFKGKLQETFAIEYADRARLYVPVSQAHLLGRYVTAGGRKAKIHRLGGASWAREKQAAQKAIYTMAAALLETQALRETIAGFSFPADSAWQRDFEAAFPYEETDDQEKAVREVKADMESAIPMDRLVCGDVGYGKTEVAMRAAFKAVMAGKQVAVLVPTTVLALQHYEVFQRRMENYPIHVELLCRFRSAAEQERVVGELRAGAVDIVIGTHRLLQADIGFKQLGLIIIDEEQRFGVAHKEHLKNLKKLVDVLTLTATPIPRTLYLSLAGSRKISMVQTPPKDRQPIETLVAKNEDRLVREAILRELHRGGQVFYLHNRVATIGKVCDRLKTVVPEARLAIAHGQMLPHELAARMHAFSRGLFDVLLCTTIIESGVDLPNVNTIIIDRADRFGIADLYQLRGRVGRSDRRAYAYLLTPSHGYLLDVSRRRLQAIMEHTRLGSGFKLAMMDLEIRGAGNLLGAEQSGYIAAIGFDLYCQLLRRAVEGIKGGGRTESAGTELPGQVDVDVSLDFIDLSARSDRPDSSAFLPAVYVEDEQIRAGIYRKIAAAQNEGEINALRDEFRDRFGALPAPFDRVLKMAMIRVAAAAKNISVVESKEGKIMFCARGEYIQVNGRFPRLKAASADGKLAEIMTWLGRMKKVELNNCK